VETNPLMPLVNTSRFILLGEDDEDDQDFLKEALHSIDHTYRFKAVSNGRNLLSFLEELEDGNLPDLIVLDYNLPVLNGAEILKILKDHDRYLSIPKIVWSTSKSPVFRADCLSVGASDYIVKPTDVATFAEVAKYMTSFFKIGN
jgi:CheY-like chemotaxis protein